MKLFPILFVLITVSLSGCGEAPSEKDAATSVKTQSLKSIYSLYKLPDGKLESINCVNASDVLREHSELITVIWVEKTGSNWNQYKEATNFCNATESYVKFGMCGEKQKDLTENGVEVKGSHVETTLIYPEYPACVYKKKINLKIDSPVDGEIWSSGDCQYPQPKETRRFLLCA